MRAKFIKEGVGDKYLYKKHGIKNDFDEFDRRYNSIENRSKLNLIGSFISRSEDKVDVYKNPKLLNNLQSWVRGCSDREGNLYIADDQDILHDELAYFLVRKGMKDDFVDWQRFEDTSTFYLAEGYDLSMEGLENALEDDQKETINTYAPRVEKANPQFNFIYNKTILEA